MSEHRGRRPGSLLERIMRDVASWFESEDEGFGAGRGDRHRPWPDERCGGAGHRHHDNQWRRGDGERRGRDYGRGGYSRAEDQQESGGRPAQGPYAGIGPRAFRRSPERLRELICERLTDDPDVDASDIEVHVQGDEVTLTGQVDTRSQKRAAEACTEAVAGVRDVHNRLTLRRPQQTAPDAGGWQGAGGSPEI